MKGLLIQEEKMLQEGGGRKNYSVRDMIEELVTANYAQWAKSNVKFKPPVVADTSEQTDQGLGKSD